MKINSKIGMGVILLLFSIIGFSQLVHAKMLKQTKKNFQFLAVYADNIYGREEFPASKNNTIKIYVNENNPTIILAVQGINSYGNESTVTNPNSISWVKDGATSWPFCNCNIEYYPHTDFLP